MDNSNGVAPTSASHVTGHNSLQTNMSKDEWNRKYWFSGNELVTVTNPQIEDYYFLSEGRNYMVPGEGGTQRLFAMAANVYLDNMSKILAQIDDRLAYMSDPNLKRVYYDKLIITVENLSPEVNMVPAYLRQAVPAGRPQIERAPWDAAMGERATDIAPNPVIPAPSFPEPRLPAADTTAKAEERSFELEGQAYKMVVSATGQKMHYRDSKLISAADYNKAASML